VFLSYAGTDEAWVRRLAEDRKRYGLLVWLDEDEIRRDPAAYGERVAERGPRIVGTPGVTTHRTFPPSGNAVCDDAPDVSTIWTRRLRPRT
jgi:hypothetical protein